MYIHSNYISTFMFSDQKQSETMQNGAIAKK